MKFKCETCSKEYSRKDSYEKHIINCATKNTRTRDIGTY